MSRKTRQSDKQLDWAWRLHTWNETIQGHFVAIAVVFFGTLFENAARAILSTYLTRHRKVMCGCRTNTHGGPATALKSPKMLLILWMTSDFKVDEAAKMARTGKEATTDLLLTDLYHNTPPQLVRCTTDYVRQPYTNSNEACRALGQ